MSIKDLAAGMTRAGYVVGPVTILVDSRGKKTPVFPGGAWNTGTDWFTEETTGLFVDCGASGIVVVDLDKHDETDGVAALRAAGIEIPETPMNLTTRSGGLHLYFRQPENPVGTHQNAPASGVDIRGIGGIVFGPGTRLSDGSSYGRPERPLTVEQLPVLPEYFRRAIESATEKPERVSTLSPFTGELSDHQRDVLEDWYLEDLTAVRSLRDGERHSNLLTHVNRILGRGNQLGYDTDVVVAEITEAYRESGGVDFDDLNEIIRTGIDWTEENPLPVPEDYIDPESVRFEDAVRAEVSKIRVREEAKRRARQDTEETDLGRELDFNEPPDGLYGKHWVDRVIPAGETVLLFGERNVGKSFVAIDLGLSVASGRPWHGRKVVRGNVLYLAGEGAIGLPSRRRSWVQNHRVENPDNFRLRDRIVRLNNPASMAAWQKVIVDQEIDLVILDTVRRSARGMEMENPGEAQEIIELMDDLRSVRHGCSVLALGHPTKSQPEQPAGAGVVQDALPVIHRITNDGWGETTRVDMDTTKAKDWSTGPLFSFDRKVVGESLVLVPTAGLRSQDA